MSIVGLYAIGRFGRPEVLRAGILVPGILVGAYLSRYTARRLDRGYIRIAVLVVSAASAAVVVIRQIL